MLIPAAATVLGGVASTFLRPAGRLKSHAQHFAAGVVLAAVAVEVIPELERARERQSAWPIVTAFAVGSTLMFALKWIEHRRAHVGRKHGSPLGMILAATADIAVDGLVIGAGIAKGEATGLLLATGLSIELLFVGVSIASAFEHDAARWKPAATTIGLAMVLCAGALGGAFVLRAVAPVFTNVALAFGSAAMLYLVTEELLVEAHESADAPSTVASLFAGFSCFWLLEIAI